ncbi:MAG: VWA domain-containing protein [Myxococcales bacterium]
MSRLSACLLACCLALTGCDDAGGPVSGEEVRPEVAPPVLERVKVAPPEVERSRTTRVVVRDPNALAATQVDLFRQSDGVVDILWVIDTTGSMATERKLLADNFDRFIDTLLTTRSRFQIGVTSTDMSKDGERGALRGRVKIIDNDTPNPKDVFRENTTFPDSRKRWMQSLRAMETALTDRTLSDAPGKPNYGFLRPNAALAVIVVSDGDDESFGGTPYYARRLRSVKGKGYENLISFSAIAGTLPDGCYRPGEESFFGSKADPPVRLSDMTRRTGGVLASICDRTFESALVRIAEALNTLKRVFPLSLLPDAATISVTVDGRPVANHPVYGWQYREEINSIAFAGDYVPPPGSQVRIFYAIDRP